LKKNQSLKNIPQFNFYEEMKMIPASRWRAFLANLDQQEIPQTDWGKVLYGADLAFDHFIEAYEQMNLSEN